MSTIYDSGDCTEGGNPPDSGTGSAHDFQASPTSDRGLGTAVGNWDLLGDIAGLHETYDSTWEPITGATTFTSGTNSYDPGTGNYGFDDGASFRLQGTVAVCSGSYNCTLIVDNAPEDLTSVVTIQLLSLDGAQLIDVTPSGWTQGTSGNPFTINTTSLFGRETFFFPRITFTAVPDFHITDRAIIEFKTT